MRRVAQNHSAGVALILGLLAALWSASGYVGAFGRAANAIYEVEEGRPFYKLRPLQVLVTLICVILLALVALSLVITGPVAKAVGDAVGLGAAAVTAWDIAKWPVMALVVWIIASAGFAFYVANFSSYNKTYGTLAAVVVFLVWLWISNLAVLFGAEFNAELERGRELQAGMLEAEDRIQLPPRDTKKMKHHRGAAAVGSASAPARPGL